MDATVVVMILMLIICLFGLTTIFSLNPYFVIYILLSIVFVFQGMSTLNPMGSTRSTIFAIGSTLILVFFGYRWFYTSAKKSNRWPPTINMCPDYLTFIPTITGSDSTSGGGCVDLLGVSSKGTFTPATKSVIARGLNASTNSSMIFPYTSADIAAATKKSDIQQICSACQTSGLTWEGVYDGDTCNGLSRWDNLQGDKENCSTSS